MNSQGENHVYPQMLSAKDQKNETANYAKKKDHT